nr:hypothetical protein [Zoogloea dura]
MLEDVDHGAASGGCQANDISAGGLHVCVESQWSARNSSRAWALPDRGAVDGLSLQEEAPFGQERPARGGGLCRGAAWVEQGKAQTGFKRLQGGDKGGGGYRQGFCRRGYAAVSGDGIQQFDRVQRDPQGKKAVVLK